MHPLRRLVFGANGKVGQAAIQLATMAGARVFAIERRPQLFVGHAGSSVDMIDASTPLGRCGNFEPIILRQQQTLRQNSRVCRAY